MRDLATYEFNYSTNSDSNMITNIMAKVEDAKKDIDRTLKFDEEGDPYLSDTSYQHEFMDDNYNDIESDDQHQDSHMLIL